jgi:hypothetical protein
MITKRMCLFIAVFFQFILNSHCRSEEQRKEEVSHSAEEISHFFDDVLLIINFNHPFYDNIKFLKEIYAPFFKNIVFYGEEPHPEVNVISHYQGWFVHRAIRDAMQKWPYFKGYICCQDDCLMNFWNYPRLDKDKIWLHSYWTASLNMEIHPWVWWNGPFGHVASVEAYKKLSNRAIECLEGNCGPQAFAYTWADFVYISGKYREEFIQVSECFDNPNVFIEIAIPTIVLCLEKYDDIEHLNPYWGGSTYSIDPSTYQTHYDWIHPLKLSNPDNQTFIRNVMFDIFPLRPLPPSAFYGKVIKNEFAGQTEYIHQLKWKASPDLSIIGYKLFCNGCLIKEISARGPFVFNHHNRRKNKSDHYELKSINDKELESRTVSKTLP